MSALPRYPSDIGYAGLQMGADEYLALGETAEQYELINGVVVMSPSPTPWHSQIVVEIIGQLHVFKQEAPGLMVFSETDIRLSAAKVYRPDIAVYALGRLNASPSRLDLPPDLIVEVLSPGTKPLDLITKREDYDTFGVGEYWVVDPADGRVRRWVREGAVMNERSVTGDSLASTALAGFALDLRPLRPRA